MAIDDATRLAYVELWPDERGASAHAFLARAAAWYAERGVRIERVMSDNGAAYRSRVFGARLATLGARHLRTRPYTPRTNGNAERFIQTLLREWAYAAPYAHSTARAAALTPYLAYYNAERPHMALGGHPPQHRLASSVNNVLVNNT